MKKIFKIFIVAIAMFLIILGIVLFSQMFRGEEITLPLIWRNVKLVLASSAIALVAMSAISALVYWITTDN